MLHQLLSLTFFTSWPQFVGACLVLLAAQVIYVMFGFGAGLIAVGAMAVFIPDVTNVVVILLLINLPAEVFVVTTSWRSITWAGVLFIFVGLAVGVPLGSVALKFGDPSFILTLLGGMLIATGLVFLALPGDTRVRWPVWTPPAAGLASGLLAGMFGTGAPPLILYYRMAGVDKATFRGNLMAIFLLITLIRVPSYVFTGLLTMERMWSALMVLPAVILGGILGDRIHLRIEELTFQRLVAVLLAILGIMLFLR